MDDLLLTTDDEILDNGDISFDDGDLEFDDSQIGFDDENIVFGDDDASQTTQASREINDFNDDVDFNDGDLDADIDGTVVEDEDLMSDDSSHAEPGSLGHDFIGDNGSIVVQDVNDFENGFDFKYIPIDKIVITQRIRKLKSVESLVQSIQSTGLLMPVVVARTATEGLYVLLNGFRRMQACAKAGKTKIPCIINNNVNTPEIPILEAMYNHSQSYSIKEQVDYIDYLEKEKGIMNPSMIEYLLQMNNGDYSKLKDVLDDNDDDIVTKLMDGIYDIGTAFKKLEQRRKKESAEEKEDKKAARVYNDESESGADQIAGSGEEADGDALTEDQIKALTVNAENIDEDIDDSSLGEMIEEGKDLEGFKPHKQKVGEREYVDPIIKKTVMTRDNSTCQCCKRGGEQYVDILDYHHILPVFLGGADTPENGIMLCVACHRLVHLYSTGDLHIDSDLLKSDYADLDEEAKKRYENEQIFEDEKKRFKRIIKLGGVIRKGMVAKGMNKEQYKKEHSNANIGRRKPGVNAEQENT